jgi:hypothetical protein
MKTLRSLLWASGLALLPCALLNATPAPPAGNASPAAEFVSPSLAETIRMIRAGVEDTVLHTFVQKSAGTLNLGADQIVFLRDLGASPELLDAMMQHDREIALRAVPGRVTTPATTASLRWRELITVTVPDQLAEWQSEPAHAEFVAQLAPFGQWFQLDGYGWCWQPWIATLRPTWQPYCQGGRWLASDHGWYWESDFSWGSLVFHYGRWFYHVEAGWCWWPETRWASAWVTWRTGPEWVAWAPLPPGSDLAPNGQGLSFLGETVPWTHDFNLDWEDYVCLPWSQFYCSEPGQMRLRGDEAAEACRGSRSLNDFFVGSDGTTVNRGLPLGRVMQASGVNLQTLFVRQVPLTAGRAIEPDRVATVNGLLQILHPCVIAPASSAPSLPAPQAPAFTWTPSQPQPSFPTPWRGPAPVTLSVTPPTEFEQFAEDLLRHPTYETAPEQPKTAYPVPARYPVKLTDPILSPRPYSAVSANLNIIRLFPR